MHQLGDVVMKKKKAFALEFSDVGNTRLKMMVICPAVFFFLTVAVRACMRVWD